METTHLGLTLPNVLKTLKEMLIRKGFIVQTMPTSTPVLIAYKNGGWLSKPKQVVFEFTAAHHNITSVDITAILNHGNDNDRAEKILERNFVNALCNTFKKAIPPYGT